MKNNVFLTFDDGPNEPYTSQILDILKEFGAKASFFACGKSVEYFPETTQRILNEGHALGNHTYSHSIILTFTGFLKREIERTTEVLFVKVSLFETILLFLIIFSVFCYLASSSWLFVTG